MKLRTIVLIVATLSLTAACSGRNEFTGSSPLAVGGAGAARSTADDAATDLSRYSAPNVAPAGWTFEWQGQVHEDGSQSFFAAWTPMRVAEGLVPSYETEFQVYTSANVWSPLACPPSALAGQSCSSVFTNAPTKFQGVIPAHTRMRARTRGLFQNGGASAWTAFKELSVGWPDRSPEPPADECWLEAGDGFVRFFRR